MKQALERIKKSPYLTYDETHEIMLIAKRNKILKKEVGLLIGLKQPAFWRRRKAMKVPRILGELFLIKSGE